MKVSLNEKTPVGELRERIIVGLSNSKKKTVNIPVFASVKGELRLDPLTISFGIIEGKKPLERKARLRNRGKEDIAITSVSTTDPALEVSFKTLKAGRDYEIVVKLDPAAVQRDLRASIDILTDSDAEKNLSLNVYGVLPPGS